MGVAHPLHFELSSRTRVGSVFVVLMACPQMSPEGPRELDDDNALQSELALGVGISHISFRLIGTSKAGINPAQLHGASDCTTYHCQHRCKTGCILQ